MLALYRSGRQAEALEAYREARRALVDELGIEPGRELRELERRSCARTRRSTSGRRAAAEPRAEPAAAPFVGRERELAELAAALDDALAGRGGSCSSAGEPGIGKSRLADELARQAARARRARARRPLLGGRRRAGRTGRGCRRCAPTCATPTPTRCATSSARDGAELATILPELASCCRPGRRRRPRPRARASGCSRRSPPSCGRRARRARSSLFLDDLHAADAPSLLLLRFVAGELGGAPLLVVGCYRDTEVGPGAGRRRLAELAREPAARRRSRWRASAAPTRRACWS